MRACRATLYACAPPRLRKQKMAATTALLLSLALAAGLDDIEPTADAVEFGPARFSIISPSLLRLGMRLHDPMPQAAVDRAVAAAKRELVRTAGAGPAKIA